MKKFLESPIFYMGNKYKLLKQIIPLFPKCETFIDLFGGSGVVCMNFKGTKRTIYNELNPAIVELVTMVKNNDVEDLDNYFNEKIKAYNIISMGKDYREHREEQKGYYDFRNYYNNCTDKDYRDLYLLTCYSINHLIRFNKNNEFNASAGASGRYIKEKIINGHNGFQGVDIICQNALDFNLDSVTENDFIYLDPPYLNTNAIYNEKRVLGGWDIECDFKLFKILEKLNNKKVKFALSNVFENRGVTNEHLIEWCKNNSWEVHHLNRNYNPFSKGNSNNDEVLICNYKVVRDGDT